MDRSPDFYATKARQDGMQAFQTACHQLFEVAKQAGAIGFTIKVTSGGHNWHFVRGTKVELKFWPANSKAQRPTGKPFQCKGAYAALNICKNLVAKEKVSGEG